VTGGFSAASCAVFSDRAMSNPGLVAFAPYQTAATEATPTEQVVS